MRVRWIVMVLVVAMVTAPLYGLSVAVGSVTVSSQTVFGSSGSVRQYTASWTSSAGGAVIANPFSVVPGDITAVKCVPNTGGTQPSDLYDLTLVDANSIDILGGQGANLSNSTGLYLQFNPPFYFPGSGASQTLDLVIANAGSAKTGVCTLWVK